MSASVAADYGCNATCYEVFSADLAIDAAAYGALCDEDFYATATNFSGQAPGDMLKYQPTNPRDMSGSVPKLIDDLSAVGVKKSPQSVLVVQGLEDVSVLPDVVESAYDATCEVGSEVHLQLYPGLSHDPVIPASAPAFLQWMDDRFDGVATRGSLKRTVEPFDLVDMYTPEDE